MRRIFVFIVAVLFLAGLFFLSAAFSSESSAQPTIGAFPVPLYDESILDVTLKHAEIMTQEEWLALGDVYFAKSRASSNVFQAMVDGDLALYCVQRAQVAGKGE